MVLKAVYGSVNRNLMHFIHPIFGNPVFQCGFVFVFGGFFTFSSNAAKLEAQAFGACCLVSAILTVTACVRRTAPHSDG